MILQVTRKFPEDNETDTNNNKDDSQSEETSSSLPGVPWIDDTDKESSVS